MALQAQAELGRGRNVVEVLELLDVEEPRPLLLLFDCAWGGGACVCGGWRCVCFRALGAGDWSTPAGFGADVVFCLARFGSAAVRVARFAGAAVFRVACFGAAVVRVTRRFDRGAAVFRVARFACAAVVLRFGAAVVLRRVAPLRTGDRGVSELHGHASNGPRGLRAALYVPAGAMAMLQSKSMSATLLVQLGSDNYIVSISSWLVEPDVHHIAAYKHVLPHACIARSGLHRSGACVALRVVGECVGGKCVGAFVASRA